MRTSSLEPQDQAQQLPESSSQLFKFALYLASNNLLSESQVDHLLRWQTERKLVNAIISHPEFRMPNMDAYAARILGSAARNGDANLLDYLKDLGIDLSPLKGLSESQLLRRAVEEHDMEVVLFLIESGAEVNPPSTYTCSPLQLAVEEGQVKLVEALLHAGANMNAQSQSSTLLSEALHCDDSTISRILINAGADVHECWISDDWEFDMEALEWAKIYANSEIVQLLSRAVGREALPVTREEILKAAGQGVGN